ncbi:MAG: phenylalanine--tRNA ligase subunit beta [Phycisphaerae bacterium]|nr:phenylalanine--tRNA ligase subunit beta [Phycisphaerae bacterium]
MPIIDMPVDMLLARISSEGDASKITADDLGEILPKLGCEVEEVADMQEFVCKVCGKIYDRTEAQGPPLHCSNCGADFRTFPEELENLGTSRVLRLDMLAVRPDIFDPGGMARYIRGYLGIQTGLPEYVLSAARIKVQVDPDLSNEDSYRPYIACAVVRNVELDNNTIKMVMNLQEDLHWALGRDRKLASIGVYDLDTLAGDVFHYDAVVPDGLKFVPLGLSPNDPDANLTPREILEQHKTGQEYAHLLKPLKKYPLLRDGEGTVLSMPPIINSESTRVTMKTKQFFIDVTGISQRTVDRALNIVATSLKEIMPRIEVECVMIESPAGEAAVSHAVETDSNRQSSIVNRQSASVSPVVRITPDLTPAEMTLNVRQAAETIGIDINAAQLAELLESMGHGVEEGPHGETLKVLVPAYRNDVMHPIDLIEDAAIAYGYDNLKPELVPTFTVGSPWAIEEHSATARRVLTGLGFHQVMTLVLSSEPAAFGKWRIEPDPRTVKIENPISTEQTICRVSILPGLLETLAINKQYDLPQYLFEVGDCCFVDPDVETGAREERIIAACMIGTHVGYADIRAVTDAFVHEMGVICTVKATDHPSYIPGRAAALFDDQGKQVGVMGEVHPEVLENYGLKHPVSVMELSLEKLLEV